MNLNYILTPCILQTIIICMSLLLALLCITSLIKNLKGTKDNCGNCPSKMYLSYKFIVGILIFLLIILFSHKFYSDDNIFNFLSFASAIISIILAVLTMIYTFLTQGTTSSAANKIEKASAEITKAVISVQEATQAYEDSARSLQQNIGSITASLSNVEEQTKRILLEQMENNQKESSSGRSFNITDKDLHSFVESASQMGTIALYAASLANEFKKDFKLNIIADLDQAWYAVGFIISTSCFNLLEAELNYRDDNLYMSVSEFSKKLKEEVKSKVEKKTNNNEDFYSSNKKVIDTYFEKISD